MKKIFSRKWITALLFAAALAFVLPACSHDSDDDDTTSADTTSADTTTASTYSTPAAVVSGAVKSADMSASGISTSKSSARVLFGSNVGKEQEDAAVATMTGEAYTGPIFSMLEQLSSGGYLSNMSFNTLLEPNASITVQESSVTVKKIQVNRNSDGSVFYIYTDGYISDIDYHLLFLLKCTVNSFGTLDTDVYFPDADYTEFEQLRWATSGKTRFAYRLDNNDEENKDYFFTTATSSGLETYWQQKTTDTDTKYCLASNRTYTGVYATNDSGIYQALLDSDGTVLCRQTNTESDTNWNYGTSESESLYNQYSSLITRAEAMYPSFPTMSVPSGMSELKTLLEAWN